MFKPYSVPRALGLMALTALCAGAVMARPALETLVAPSPAAGETRTPARLTVQTVQLPQGTVYTVTIPGGSGYSVEPVSLASLTPVAGVADAQPAAAAIINAGFFDPGNGKTTSFITLQGALKEDPRQNERLTGNPALAPYLKQFWERTEFRVYQCPDRRYDITSHSSPLPQGCTLQSALGAGPNLLEPGDTPIRDLVDHNLMKEGFIARDENGKLVRDPIGAFRPNARSAVGLKANGDVVLLMAAQRPARTNQAAAGGFSLPQVASLLASMGCTRGMALDGGSSSSLWADGKIRYGKFDAKGNPVRRAVKSVLSVVPAEGG
ncbi:MAG: phosphodiester glycosidase family protein [Candidatus Melainabacteria bacterium]